MSPQPITLHRVIVRPPVTYIPTGPTTGCTVGAPPAGSFNPAHVRVTPVGDVRTGDVVLGTVQPHHGPLLEPLDRAQWVSYFAGQPTPQTVGARPYDPAHCELCAHHAYIHGPAADATWVTVDGCTLYQPDTLLLVIPRELAPAPYMALRSIRRRAGRRFAQLGEQRARRMLTPIADGDAA
jgi:hypothetical protein